MKRLFRLKFKPGGLDQYINEIMPRYNNFNDYKDRVTSKIYRYNDLPDEAIIQFNWISKEAWEEVIASEIFQEFWTEANELLRIAPEVYTLEQLIIPNSLYEEENPTFSSEQKYQEDVKH